MFCVDCGVGAETVSGVPKNVLEGESLDQLRDSRPFVRNGQ